MPRRISRARSDAPMHNTRAPRTSPLLLCTLLMVLFAWMPARPVHAQRVALDSVRLNDSTIVHELTLTDGSRIVGRIQRVTADSVRIASSVANITVARRTVQSVSERAASALRGGSLWWENPHPTRLLFAPTAIALRRGDAYVADFWIFFVSAAVGVTDRLTIGGGSTLVPGLDFNQNIFYLLPKLTVVKTPKFNLALGALAAHLGLGKSDIYGNAESRSLGVLYGVATAGSRESNLSLGAGWGYAEDKISNRPVLTIGGQHRVGKRVALISENWILPFEGNGSGFISYGVRLLAEKVSIDLALGNVPDQMFFPGIPLVGVAFKF
ncbi:MAG: hypothetical protein H7Z40_21565 [Phycisphaerae bacterium]|nr:hypothetical protein [Gemmatimonadaceae bacterium]